MKPGTLCPKLLFVLLISIGMAQEALACHEASANTGTQKLEASSRSFVLDVQLNKSGAVRAVQVLQGAGPLRARAVRVASTRRYHPPIGYSQTMTMIEVTFPRRKNAAPRISQAMVAGVSSCVPASAPIQWPLIPWVNQLLSSKPILPFLVQADDSKR